MEGETLDPVAILAALGLTQPARATRVLGGADAAIWRVEQADATYALRVLRADQTMQAEREAAAMATAATAGLPVPRVHATGSWQGRPAQVLDWCPGRPLSDELAARPWRAWALGVHFGRVQAAIHALPPPATLSNHPVPWQAWAGPDERLRACLDRLPSSPPALLHLDYHPLNVLIDGGRISAVLDWANARPGDPRADLARTAAILQLAPLPSGPMALPTRAVLRMLEAGWRRGYQRVAGPIGDLTPFYAWAGTVMERDLAPRLNRPDLPWLTEAYLARIHHWTTYWRTRAGITEDSGLRTQD